MDIKFRIVTFLKEINEMKLKLCSKIPICYVENLYQTLLCMQFSPFSVSSTCWIIIDLQVLYLTENPPCVLCLLYISPNLLLKLTMVWQSTLYQLGESHQPYKPCFIIFNYCLHMEQNRLNESTQIYSKQNMAFSKMYGSQKSSLSWMSG